MTAIDQIPEIDFPLRERRNTTLIYDISTAPLNPRSARRPAAMTGLTQGNWLFNV
jgi:hypothetical protein